MNGLAEEVLYNAAELPVWKRELPVTGRSPEIDARRKRMAEEDQEQIDTCEIMGVRIAAVDMPWTLRYLSAHLDALRGRYITVANVHTTVMAYDDPAYRQVQNGAVMALPDGGPLSSLGRKRGYPQMARVAGPDLMAEVFGMKPGYSHFFYGGTVGTLEKIRANYPALQIAGMLSPPFRPLTEAEDEAVVRQINESHPDFIWVGLGAPKQENWMAVHQCKLFGVMIGVGAGFDYHAGTLSRAPAWMQEHNLEWLYRLAQNPKGLLKRYLYTNPKFIWHAQICGK
jgi:N-acetylglucosaminyldiphosphoundecaprenol N-acetyl-beta-D-mannosaminyltransferase